MHQLNLGSIRGESNIHISDKERRDEKAKGRIDGTASNSSLIEVFPPVKMIENYDSVSTELFETFRHPKSPVLPSAPSEGGTIAVARVANVFKSERRISQQQLQCIENLCMSLSRSIPERSSVLLKDRIISILCLLYSQGNLASSSASSNSVSSKNGNSITRLISSMSASFENPTSQLKDLCSNVSIVSEKVEDEIGNIRNYIIHLSSFEYVAEKQGKNNTKSANGSSKSATYSALVKHSKGSRIVFRPLRKRCGYSYNPTSSISRDTNLSDVHKNVLAGPIQDGVVAAVVHEIISKAINRKQAPANDNHKTHSFSSSVQVAKCSLTDSLTHSVLHNYQGSACVHTLLIPTSLVFPTSLFIPRKLLCTHTPSHMLYSHTLSQIYPSSHAHPTLILFMHAITLLDTTPKITLYSSLEPSPV